MSVGHVCREHFQIEICCLDRVENTRNIGKAFSRKAFPQPRYVSMHTQFVALIQLGALLCSDINGEPPLPLPTRDMAKLWGRVRQLRAFLRTQKQDYKVSAESVLT